MTNDSQLDRIRRLPRALRILYARSRTLIGVGCGALAYALSPDALPLVSRLLIAWNVFAAIYLVLAFVAVFRGGQTHIRRRAVLQDDGRFLILIVTAIGAFASIAAIVIELAGAKNNKWELAFAITTITLSWALVHTTFALHYAHDFYRGGKPGGLAFPGDDHPDYWDFVYFSFVIGTTAQVSDVGITSKQIRRTAAAHGVVSFIFNTALLALMVNIAASLI
ncbi:MAG TPA: DUF1345 domain-containing protein [Xanthobacteraceae bacterium]|nr:DUF1345 domain-containing protein [Xanthobacteraceae bacterium]